jgi:hemin uptake protein HemP
MRKHPRSEHNSKANDRPSHSAQPKTLRSVDMFAGAKEVIIEHDGATYRLRQTSQGKLILTK